MLLGTSAQAALPSPSLILLHLSPFPTDTAADPGLTCDTPLEWLGVGGSAYLRWLEELLQSLR